MSLLDGTTSAGSYSGGKNGVGAQTADKSYRNPDRAGIKLVSVPLSKLLGFFGLDSYFPLRNVGSMSIRLRLHSNINSCVVCQQGAS